MRLISILVFFCPCLSFACDLCGCFIPKDTMIKGFRFGVAEQYSDFTTLQFDGTQVPNPDNQYLDSSNTQLYANYHFNERFALQLNVPLLYKSFRRPVDGVIQNGTESGIGDIWLVGYYVPYQRRNPYSQTTWRVVSGIKFPSGNSDLLSEELDEDHHDSGHEEEEGERVAHDEGEPSGIHGHDLVLGSGSYDALIGTDIYFRRSRAFVTGNVLYTIRTRGTFDYRFANDLIYFGGPGIYAVTKDTYSLGFQAWISGEYKGEDEIGNETTDDTAINAVYLGPRALIGIGQNFAAEVGVNFALSINNSGLQVVPDTRLQGGIVFQVK